MNNTTVYCLVIVTFAECLGCSDHCHCYMWEGLLRTDCIRKNLFNTFIGFPYQTQVLDLSFNVISILHGNEFLDSNLQILQDLRLHNNRLHKIDKLTFNGLELLRNLDLSFNSLEYINPSTFKYNPNLKTLNVSFNPLGVTKGEPFLSPANSLKVLDMTNCRLEFVTFRSFADLKSLRVLNISRNYVQEIEFDFLEGMESLKYLDVSQSGFPCDNQTKRLLQSLSKRKVLFQAFCQKTKEELMNPVLEMKESNRLEVYRGDYNENVTQRVPQYRSIFHDVTQFFQSIPSFYAIVCGVQFGIFIGSFSTYFCLKKTITTYRGGVNREETARGSCGGEDSENSAFILVPLNTPPGTPPSPYHSRFFPSSFSLSDT